MINCGKPRKVYFSEKPIDGFTDLSSLDWKELDCSVTNLEVDVPNEQALSAFGVSVPGSASIDFEMRLSNKEYQKIRKLFPKFKLPRKLKKYVKKTYFCEYPKRKDALSIAFVFAMHNPHKAGKVGLTAVYWPYPGSVINEYENNLKKRMI